MLPNRCRAARGAAAGLRCLALLLALPATIAGCTGPAPAQPPAASAAVVVAAPPPAPPVAAPPATDALPSAPGPASRTDALLAYADRLRGMQPAELAQEIGQIGDPPDSPAGLVRLAMALGLTRTPANGGRAQALLQRVLAQNSPEAQALHPLARLLLSPYAEARRMDEQLERQNQQLREAQRRIDLLNDRLEAVRAIERSVPSRPRASAPHNGQRP
jgi:hypothetical protein